MDSYREIENLIYEYAELIDSGNLEGMAQLFYHADFMGPDGKRVTRGAEEFLALQRRAVNIDAKTNTPRTKHITTNVIIEVDECSDKATARSYFTVLQSTGSLALQPIIAGRYKDRFERANGHWRFQQRQSIPDLIGDLSKHLLFDLKHPDT
jgi:3-phenylpropionate/cinnamic acid dioxygenase small subunit